MVSSTAVRETRRKSRVLAHERKSWYDVFDIYSLTSKSSLVEAESRREAGLLGCSRHDVARRK
jgi:hypothetical protein